MFQASAINASIATARAMASAASPVRPSVRNANATFDHTAAFAGAIASECWKCSSASTHRPACARAMPRATRSAVSLIGSAARPSATDNLALAIRDAVDRARVVVGDEERSVGHDLDVHGTAPRGVARHVEEALGEDAVLHDPAVLDLRLHHAIAALLRAVP